MRKRRERAPYGTPYHIIHFNMHCSPFAACICIYMAFDSTTARIIWLFCICNEIKFFAAERRRKKIMIEVIERGWILLVPLFIQCTHKHCQPIIRTNTQIHRPMPQIGSVHGNRCKSCIMSVIWFINPTAILPRYNSGCVYCLRILSTKLNPILVLSTNQNALINCCIEKCNAFANEIDTHTNTSSDSYRLAH